MLRQELVLACVSAWAEDARFLELAIKESCMTTGQACPIGRGGLRGVRQQEVQLELLPPCKRIPRLHRNLSVLSMNTPVCCPLSLCVCTLLAM